jgi:hypothetical protein
VERARRVAYRWFWIAPEQTIQQEQAVASCQPVVDMVPEQQDQRRFSQISGFANRASL